MFSQDVIRITASMVVPDFGGGRRGKLIVPSLLEGEGQGA